MTIIPILWLGNIDFHHLLRDPRNHQSCAEKHIEPRSFGEVVTGVDNSLMPLTKSCQSNYLRKGRYGKCNLLQEQWIATIECNGS